jgi:type II secretory pathway predicted ATPase ExeA
MGKTTILYQLLSQLKGSARTVFLSQTLCSPKELLRSLLRDLDVADDDKDTLSMQERLSDLLLAEAHQGRRVVIVIDEAQNLEDSALELLRMLSNFETTSQKLMQIILAGQPQLREKLVSPHLLQLRQRISILARLRPFSVEETHLYISHRLRVAGYDFRTPLFTPQAAALIAKHSEGIPRNINNICFNALSLGCALKQKRIREDVVRKCLDDLDFESPDICDRREDPAERHSVAFSAPKPATGFQQPFSWRSRLTVCVMLLFQLLSFTGGQRPGAGRSRPELDVSASSQMGKIHLPSAVPADRSSPFVATVNGEPEKSTKSILEFSADEGSVSPDVLSATSAQTWRSQPHADLEQTDDPTELWAQVKNEDTDAEVELARLYLKGTAVPQNCAQAKILLLAASRKGNALAATILSAPGEECP